MPSTFSDLGRFAEPALLILVSLAGGDKHGYAIMQDVEATCGARIGPGTLYSVLPRLEGRGWIEALPAVDRRRPYRLTQAGAAALRDQLTGMETLATAGLRRLATEGTTP
jgi:DNA-binding PadR family transcriptional regulator